MDQDHLIHPRYSKKLIGHIDAIKRFELAWSKNLMHHAWLISGPEGIGKATFAYHATNYILGSKNINNKMSDKIEQNKTSSLIQSSSHPDLFIAEQNINKQDFISNKIISIDVIREMNIFFSKTPSISDWKVAIIDSVNNLSLNGINSCLKIIEEPPEKSVIFIISHNKYEISKTLISRCRKLYFSQLSQKDTLEIIKTKCLKFEENELDDLSRISNGNPGFAINIKLNGGIEIYKRILEIFLSLPNLNWEYIHKLSYKLNYEKVSLIINLLRTFLYRMTVFKLFSKNDKERLQLILNESNVFIHASNYLNQKNILILWMEIAENTRKTYKINLDHKQLLINIFLNAEKLLKKNY